MTRHSEFGPTKKNGTAKGGSYLVLSSLEKPDLPHHKVGIIVTKKVGNAVVRNHLRRRIHAIITKHLSEIPGRRYIVTILRWRATDATFQELEKDWLKQARRLGLLPPHQQHNDTHSTP